MAFVEHLMARMLSDARAKKRGELAGSGAGGHDVASLDPGVYVRETCNGMGMGMRRELWCHCGFPEDLQSTKGCWAPAPAKEERRARTRGAGTAWKLPDVQSWAALSSHSASRCVLMFP